MKLINRETDYAVRALCYAAGKEGKGLISAAELVGALGIPRPFLRKILQTLNQAGILKSYKGIGGGFALERTPRDIRLTALIEIFQGPVEFNDCLFKKKICPNRSSCSLRAKVKAIEKSVISKLKGVTIASLKIQKRKSPKESHHGKV